MTVKELIIKLQKLDPNKSVYYRKGRSCHLVTMCLNSEHANGLFVELSNEEDYLKPKKK